MSERLIYILIGPPASGKGTIAKELAKLVKAEVISTGDLLRKNPEVDQEALGRGEFVSSKFITEVVIEEITGREGNVILDGFPRNEEQAMLFDETPIPGTMLASVIGLEAPEEVLISRMKKRAKEEGRADDNMETFRKRLITYEKETAPLFDYYDDLLVSVDASQSVEHSMKQIQESIFL